MRRRYGAVAALLLAGILATGHSFTRAQSAAVWPTFHADRQRDGSSPVNGATDSKSLDRFTFNDSMNVESSPAVDSAGVAYVGSDDGHVYGLDPAYAASHFGGPPRWVRSTGGPVRSSPTLSNDGSTVYVGSDDGNVYALAAADGSIKWKKYLGAPVDASPLLSADGGTIYVPDTGGTLYALSTADGSVKWSWSPGGSMPFSAASDPSGSTLYVVDGSYLYEVPASGPSGSSPANTLFLDAPGTSAPSVDQNGNVYVGTRFGELESLAPGTATHVNWTYTVPNDSAVTSTPAFFDGNAIFGGGDGYIHAVSQTSGVQAWQVQTGGPINSSPAVARGNSMVYVGSEDGKLYGLQVTSTSGTIAPNFPANAGVGIDSSPAIASDGTVWFGTRGAQVYRLGAIGAPGGPPPTSTGGPAATATPVGSTTPVATSTPTPTSTPVTVPLSVSVAHSSIKAQKRQTIRVTSSANTTVHIRINFPNGDHQSHTVTTGASGTASYSFTQGDSKIKHNNRKATVIATAGTGTAQATASTTYSIGYGVIDVSAEPRSVAAGHTITIYVHAKKGSRVLALLVGTTSRSVLLHGKTGSNGWASMKYKVQKSLVTPKKRTVRVVARFASGKPHNATQTTFTVK